MTYKSEQKQKPKWKTWVAPTIVSVVVFAILFGAKAISPFLAVIVAGLIVITGLIALKLL